MDMTVLELCLRLHRESGCSESYRRHSTGRGRSYASKVRCVVMDGCEGLKVPVKFGNCSEYLRRR